MKLITFASFKGGAGKTTAAMAVASTLVADGKKVALIDADENTPLIDWREAAQSAGTWNNECKVFQADDLRSFEFVFENATKEDFDYAIIDTRGGGSELNNACLVNTNLVIIPSALTQLDMTQALATFEYTIELLQTMDTDVPVALLIQRVPVNKLTVSQKQDLAALSQLPRCETFLHSRDAFSSIGKRGMLHLVHKNMLSDPIKRIIASHMATAIKEAKSLTNDLLETLGDAKIGH